MSSTPFEMRELLRRQWGSALKKVLMTMTGEIPDVSMREGNTSSCAKDSNQAWSWYSQDLSFAPPSTVRLGATTDTWTRLGASLLKSLGLEDVSEKDIESTCTDVVAQSNSIVAGELTKRLEADITCGAVSPAKQPETSECMVLSVAAGMLPRPVNLAVVFDESLITNLTRLSHSAAMELEFQRQIPSSVSDLLLDLHATLGKTQLLLEDILKLSIGTVIDIGRSVTDFVDVVANGKVIASGLVVAFKGNYAIKIVSAESKLVAKPAVFQGGAEAWSGGPVPTRDTSRLTHVSGEQDA